MADDLSERLDFAIEIAGEAGNLTLRYFQSDAFDVERKADASPVTQADRGAEELLRTRIQTAFPDDGIIGEEFGTSIGSSSFRWVLDPIDGTKSFISGVPLYSLLIGILNGDDSVAGVIRIPALNEMVYARAGGGAWWVRGEGEPQRTRVAERPLSAGVFLTSQVDSFAQRGAADAYHALERTADITRSWGDGYGYLLVATGRADAIVDPEMNVWDAAPLLPVLQEAGGSFTDWQGRATVFGGEGVGCSRQVRDEVLSVTREFPRPESPP